MTERDTGNDAGETESPTKRSPWKGLLPRKVSQARKVKRSRAATDTTADRTRAKRSLPLGKLVRPVLALVAIGAIVFYGFGAFYFSNQVHDRLTVSKQSSTADLRITPMGKNRIQIKAVGANAGALDQVRGPTTYAVVWRGGVGQVRGALVSKAADSVVRRFKVLEGRRPKPNTPAYLDSYAFPRDSPKVALGPGVQAVVVTSSAGKFAAYLKRPADAGSTWAILVHGQSDTRAGMFRLMRSTLAKRMPSLDITYRNDPGAPKDPSGISQAGRTEWLDLAAAVNYASAKGAKRVVLVGNSMGGAIVASYLRHRADNDKSADGLPVSAVVLDSPLLDLTSAVQLQASEYDDVPVLGAPPKSLVWLARQVSAARFGIDWHAANYVDGDPWVTMPVLIIQGSNDHTVPLATNQRFAAERPQRVKIMVVPGAGHVQSWNAAPAKYDATVRAFLGRTAR